MSNNSKIIKIPETLRDYIEKLHYENNARMNLIKFMVESDLTDKPGFEKIYTEYIEFNTEYTIAKQELEKEYLMPEFDGKFTWSVDFKSSEVICHAQD